MIDAGALTQIGVHARTARELVTFNAAISQQLALGNAGAVKKANQQISLARQQVKTAVELLGTDPQWNGMRDELQVVEKRLGEARVSNQNAPNLSVTVGRLTDLEAATAFVTKHGITSRDDTWLHVNAIFDRPPASWSQQDVSDLRTVFDILPHDFRPELPTWIQDSDGPDKMRFRELIDTDLTNEHTQEHLTRLVRAAQVMNDPGVTRAALTRRVRQLWAQGLEQGWKSPELREELMLLATDLPPRLVAPGFTSGTRAHLTGALRETDTTMLDRAARSSLLATETGMSSDRSFEQLASIVERDPSMWSTEDAETLMALVDLPEHLHPFRAGRVDLGAVHEAPTFPALLQHKLAGADVEIQLRRVIEPMRVLATPGMTDAAIRSRAHDLLKRGADHLSTEELHELRALTIDMPPERGFGGHVRNSDWRFAQYLERLIARMPMTDYDNTALGVLWSEWSEAGQSRVSAAAEKLEQGLTWDDLKRPEFGKPERFSAFRSEIVNHDRRWTLAGAERLAEVLSDEMLGNFGRYAAAEAIVDTLQRDPATRHLVDERITSILADARERLGDTKDPRLAGGYRDYPDFSDYGELRAKLDLARAMSDTVAGTTW